jgi:hypothetical protein
MLFSFHGIDNNKNDLIQSVDLVELNHYYDPEKNIFSYRQLIFYNWSEDYRRFDVVDWKLVDGKEGDLNDLIMDLKKIKWYDKDIKRNRIIYAKTNRITHSFFDPERLNKKLFPEKERLGLLKIPTSTILE